MSHKSNALPKVVPSVDPKPEGAQVVEESPPSFERERVNLLEGLAIAGVCPVHGKYEGTLSLRLDKESARSFDTIHLLYRVAVQNPSLKAERWLTELGLQALEARIATEPLHAPTPEERRARAKARRLAMAAGVRV